MRDFLLALIAGCAINASLALVSIANSLSILASPPGA